MIAVRGDPTARQSLARSTAGLHRALHRDPLLSRLTARDLTEREHRAALRVFLALHEGIEGDRMRSGCWEAFSLASVCAALRFDLRSSKGTSPSLGLRDPRAVLGALYVAHGAGFGREVLGRCVSSSLPGASARFLDLRPDPAIWDALCASLEYSGSTADRLNALSNGAKVAFGRCLALARAERALLSGQG